MSVNEITTEHDAIELLTADHTDVEQMFRQIESLPESSARDELVLAPTHPHRNAPNTPPGNLVGGAAAVIDKARDALRRG